MGTRLDEARRLVNAADLVRAEVDRLDVLGLDGLRGGQRLADALVEAAGVLPATREQAGEIVKAYAAAASGRVRHFTGWHRHERREHLERLQAAGHSAEVDRLMSPTPSGLGPRIGELHGPESR